MAVAPVLRKGFEVVDSQWSEILSGFSVDSAALSEVPKVWRKVQDVIFTLNRKLYWLARSFSG